MLINRKKILDILQADEVAALEADVEIEDIISVIKEIDYKISFLERLKKDRTKTISEEIDKLSSKKDTLKEVIAKTLEEFGHNALNFPGVGRVTNKKSSGKWEVKDETALIEILKKELDDETFATVVVQKQSIVKKELNKVLENWSIEGKKIDSAEKTKDDKSLMITYDKKNQDRLETDEFDDCLDDNTSIENYDSLTDGEVNF